MNKYDLAEMAGVTVPGEIGEAFLAKQYDRLSHAVTFSDQAGVIAVVRSALNDVSDAELWALFADLEGWFWPISKDNMNEQARHAIRGTLYRLARNMSDLYEREGF